MINHGKDGWQGVISADFTFENVRQAARQLAAGLKPNASLVIGYDTRFLADKFASEIVKVLTTAGFGCYLAEREVPLPVLAWEVADRGAAGGVMVTGGTLPADHCGLKFITGPGSGATVQGIEHFEPRERYLKYLEVSLDTEAIRKARLKIVVDPLYGAGRGYLDLLLQRTGCSVEEIHEGRDVLFGGRIPAPTEDNLEELKSKLKENRAGLGLALSGAADDFAVIEASGRYLPSSHFTKLGTNDAIFACAKVVEIAALKGLKAAA
jgi:phosphomannomutase